MVICSHTHHPILVSSEVKSWVNLAQEGRHQAMGGETRLNHWRAEVKLLSFFSLKCFKCAQSTCAVPKIKYPLSYTKSQCKGYMSGTAYLWDGWETESLLQRGKTHGSKEKSTPYFLFFRKMVIKTTKRAKLKPFNSTSCRSEGCSPTLRSCLTHPLPSCPSCKSCQESDVL